MRKLLIKFAKLMSEYNPGRDTAHITNKITKNRDFAAELFANRYFKDLEEDEEPEE